MKTEIKNIKNNETKVNNNNNKSITLRLSTSTPLQALEAKAARAAFIAKAESATKKSVAPQAARAGKPKRAPLTELEREVNFIHRALEKAGRNHTEVRVEKPAWSSSAACILSTYAVDPAAKRKPQDVALESMTSYIGRPAGVGAKRTYVFYASAIDPSCLGSVSIYGANVCDEYEALRRRGSIFGIPFRSVAIEVGRRPFIDITFRP